MTSSKAVLTLQLNKATHNQELIFIFCSYFSFISNKRFLATWGSEKKSIAVFFLLLVRWTCKHVVSRFTIQQILSKNINHFKLCFWQPAECKSQLSLRQNYHLWYRASQMIDLTWLYWVQKETSGYFKQLGTNCMSAPGQVVHSV